MNAHFMWCQQCQQFPRWVLSFAFESGIVYTYCNLFVTCYIPLFAAFVF